MTLSASGYLGIATGSAAPNYPLEVNGDMQTINLSSNYSRIKFGQYGSAGTSYTFIQGDARNTGYMAFYTNVTQNMTLTAAVRLLINKTNEETYQLDVNGTGRFSGDVIMSAGASSAGNISILTNSSSRYGAFAIGRTASEGYFAIAAANDNFGSGTIAGDIVISAQGSSQQFKIATNNVVRLTIASGGAATFTSSVTATSFFESSDSRLKTLIQDNYQTKGIASITPKLYTKNGKVELGYYAQDFVGILDSAVSKGSDDMLSLSYREVLVAKVYALEQEIKDLKAKLN